MLCESDEQLSQVPKGGFAVFQPRPHRAAFKWVGLSCFFDLLVLSEMVCCSVLLYTPALCLGNLKLFVPHLLQRRK